MSNKSTVMPAEWQSKWNAYQQTDEYQDKQSSLQSRTAEYRSKHTSAKVRDKEVSTDVEHFDGVMVGLLNEVSDEYTAIVKEQTAITVDEVNEAIKEHAPVYAGGSVNRKHNGGWRTPGTYVKHFATRTAYEDDRNLRMQWYVRSPESSLTHLLEYGHRIRVYPYGHIKAGLHEYQFSDARPREHVKYGEAAADKLEQNIKEAIENS